MKKHRNNGLRKFCGHPRREWARCGCPWHANYRSRRVSLNRHFGLSPGHQASKSEALELLDRLRAEVRAGAFGRPAETPAATTTLTFGGMADKYLTLHVRVPTRKPGAIRATENYVAILKSAKVPGPGGSSMLLKDRPIDAVTKADVESARDWRRAQLHRAPAEQRVRPGEKDGEIGIEHLLQTLRHMFNWAIAEGYVDHTPFKRHGVTVIRVKSGRGNPRTRRLDDGEEERLLAHASPHLRALIVAALESGCRVGELLGLRWRDVRWAENVLLLAAVNTKTREARDVPMTARLREILEARRFGPNGTEHPPDAFAFGNEAGERVGRIHTAWRAACRRANVAGLHFHDLRREFASRLLESGAANHDVRDWLGHANITTTSRYLSTTRTRLQKVSRQFEEHRGAPSPPPRGPERPAATGGAPAGDGGTDQGAHPPGVIRIVGGREWSGVA